MASHNIVATSLFDEIEPKRHEMTQAEYDTGVSEGSGICLSCGNIADTCEEESTGEECDTCGEYDVVAFETAFVDDKIEIED
jgi:hypothetical protein